ncbi:hypothetical protein KY284_030465 [Solanum tuberosum]|nr:hypothetical protein KY284_030465 [Solanum tuberosum]
MRALSVKNKLGFIDESCVKPSANSSQLRQWQICDDMVTSWILNSLTKEILDFVEYVNDSVKLWKVWEELSTLNLRNQCSCICNCGAKDNMYKAEHDRRLIQFLIGLNEVYTIVRGNILMINPLPSMEKTFSLLIQKEKHRVFRSTSRMPMDLTSLNACVLNNKVQAGRASGQTIKRAVMGSNNNS